MKKVIIFGGRDFTDEDVMATCINQVIDDPFILICGEARGADRTAKELLEYNNYEIESYPADWDTYGKRAGFIRNEQMGDIADMAIGFWDGQSKGTKHMYNYMRKLNKPVWVFNYSGELYVDISTPLGLKL